MEKRIAQLIIDEVISFDRPDLFRKPIVAFSSAEDERCEERMLSMNLISFGTAPLYGVNPMWL